MTAKDNLKHIVKIRFGSHLYGTSTFKSDTDIKTVYLPMKEDILLQRVNQTITSSTNKQGKNNSSDIDIESYTPYKFLHLLLQGQTVALDMLFAPDCMYLEPPSPLWIQIKDIGRQLLNKHSAMFVSYCKHQANKYGLKGERIVAAQLVISLIEAYQEENEGKCNLYKIEAKLSSLCESNKYLSIHQIDQLKGITQKYLEVCGKKIIFTTRISEVRKSVNTMINAYEKRALEAEKEGGIDWKALSHAVRIANQAIEFLNEHNITFPRPEATHLVDIKSGKIPYEIVSQEIDSLVNKVELAYKASSLPSKVDSQIIEQYIGNLYRNIVFD